MFLWLAPPLFTLRSGGSDKGVGYLRMHIFLNKTWAPQWTQIMEYVPWFAKIGCQPPPSLTVSIAKD